MKTLNRIKTHWLIPLLMALALFRPFSSLALDNTPNFSWLELIPPGYWLDSWSFEDTNWDSDFGFATLSYTNIVQVPDWDGNALQVDTTNAAWLTYAITEYAPGYGEYTNLTFKTGSIEFMFAPNWQSADTNYYGNGPGDWGRFIDIGTWDTNADSDWWSLYLNPSGTGIYFSSGTNGVRTNYLNTPISWDSSQWHMIVLTFSPSNTFIYLDGQLAASGDGVRYLPTGSILTNGFAVGSDFATGMQQVHGQIDDLYTYNYQLSPDDVASDYADVSPELPGAFHPMDDGLPFPGGGGGSGGGDTNEFPNYTPPDYGTNLYLVITNAVNNLASGWITNSSIYVPYTIFSRQNLLWPIWTPEATFYGSWVTNSTAFSVPMLARNDLFLEARSEIAPRIVGGGNTHFATLRRDGTVWTWGDGEDGQLGNGQWTNSSTPVQVGGLSNVVAITVPATGDYTLALDACGKVWSWGDNSSGQLGRNDGLYENADMPATIAGLSNIVAIAGGSGHAIALRSDGTVWAWGDNAYGDLGNGTNTQRDYAAPVSGLTNAIVIASGDSHCFAICANGTVWGWGLNEDWELGIGNANDQWLPVLVGNLTNAVALSGGYDFSVALLANGTIEAWGANYLGEIGSISSSMPVSVPGLSNIVSIASGGLHSLFINTNGNLFAWGWDGEDQFGDNGANDGSTVPYLTAISNVTAIAGGAESSIISTGNGNIYTFGNSYEYETAPTLTDVYTNYSSDGSGLPDWWERMYFGHLGLDPNSDPAGDGWTLLQDYEQGYNPTNFITPPAITGLIVTQTNGQNGATLTWSAAIPTPLDYAIYRIDYNYDTWQYGLPQQIGEVAGNVTTFMDNGSISGGDQNSIYEAIGIYGGGTSPFSAQAYINSASPPTLTDNLPFTAVLVRNGTGRWQIMFSGLPTGLQTIQLTWQSGSGATTQDISVSNIVNGVYPISDSDVLNDLGATLYAQGIGPDNLPGQQIYAGVVAPDAPYFVNGQEHMEQNLDFLIRAASIYSTFGDLINENPEDNVTDYRLVLTATNFEEFSFIHHNLAGYRPADTYDTFDSLDNLWPFTENYNLANDLVDTSRTNSPWGTNSFNFEPDFATNIPAPAVLNADPYLILQPSFFGFNDVVGAYPNASNWAITVSTGYVPYEPYFEIGTNASQESGINNLFGLPYQTGCIVDLLPASEDQPVYLPFSPGDSVNVNPPDVTNDAEFGEEITPYDIGAYASGCPAPTLYFENYYFAPLFNTNVDSTNLPPVNQQPYPLPIDDNFNVTNQTPAVILGAVGQPMILGAWAKYSIQGSSPTKYAYLGQYFTTNAWELDGSGNPTTTNAGIVSPYGEFFPTQPGPVALITMTNLDTGTQATGIVNVISLALDANHDGTVDPTWNGADFTSPSRPYVFWANNNYDRTNWDVDDQTFYDEDVESNSASAISPFTGQSAPDYEYRDSYGNRVIPTPRDLEDFARLWVCGLTSNLVAALPANSTVTLNWGDVGNPNPNNPTIDIFTAGDEDGGLEYLTNSESAADQIDSVHAPYVGRLAPGGSIQLNGFQFNGWAGNHFIWCGVTNGTGALTLTITDPNSNVLAQTSVYIQLEDIKQMYERWTVGDDPSEEPATYAYLATDSLPQGVLSPFRFTNPANANTPYILFVHGWNCSPFDKDWFSQTAFKRLYWQGYQGRFGEFRWPTYYGFLGTLDQLFTNMVEKDNYDDGEYQAWQSAQGLLYKLEDLNNQYPGQVYVLAHSMGNVVTGEALRLAGTNQVVNTYIASQAAISAHTYDPTIPDYSFVYLPWSAHADTPNIYNDWFEGNDGGGAGRIISLYNTNDFALSRGHWQLDQLFKPDQEVYQPETGFTYDYGYNGSASDPPPWTNFFSEVGGIEQNLNIYGDFLARYQTMAYAAESYTTAFGATPNVGNLTGTKDLQTVWPFPDPLFNNYASHFYHSAEFRGDAPWEWNYWNTVLYSSQYGFNISGP